MLRTDMVAKLQLVDAARSAHDFLPILQQFWFDGKTLSAYNDHFAASVPFMATFVGALPPSLLSILKESKAKEVEVLSVADNEINFRLASAKVKMALSQLEPDIFTMPEWDPKVPPVKVDAAMREAIEFCLWSLKGNQATPERLGITFMPAGPGKFLLFSTNGATISRAAVEVGNRLLINRLTIYQEFCETLISSTFKNDPLELQFRPDSVLARSKSGIKLFVQAIDVTRPQDFAAVIDAHIPPKAEADRIEMPARLPLLAKRAVIATAGDGDAACEVREEKLVMKTKGKAMEITDVLAVPKHKPVSFTINPSYIEPGIGGAKHLLFTDRCVILWAGDKLRLIANVGG